MLTGTAWDNYWKDSKHFLGIEERKKILKGFSKVEYVALFAQDFARVLSCENKTYPEKTAYNPHKNGKHTENV